MQMCLQKVKRRETWKKFFFLGVLKVNDEKKQDPDPLVRGTDPRIRILAKMSRICNTVSRDGEREARLDGIREQMMGVDPETRIHFEMASFVDETLLGEKSLVPKTERC
jgi:hypothetical protein